MSGPVTTDHKKLTMQFQKGNQTTVLQVDPHLAESVITKAGLRRLVARKEVAFFFHLRREEVDDGPQTTWALLDHLLEDYKDGPSEPSQLPPNRMTTDHHIDLIPGSQLVNVHSYEYPHFQKNEIEYLTVEMLKQGLIRHSTGSFSLLLLLVKKKDGSWYFCVNYCTFNAITIRNCFPIPTMNSMRLKAFPNWIYMLSIIKFGML